MSDTDEIQFLTADCKDEVMSGYESTYVLKAVGNLPECAVMIRSASFSKINSFRRAADSGDHKKQLRALCGLIADSVVGPNGNRVWSDSEVTSIAEGSTRRFMELQTGVLQHNGLNEDGRTIEELADDEAKN